MIKRFFLIAVAVLLLPSLGSAQVMLQKAVVSSGGSQSSNGTINAGLTAGQAVTGTASNGTINAQLGFWTSEQAASSNSVSTTSASGLTVSTWPNPTSDVMNVSLTLGSAANIDLRLFDLTGKEVRTLLNGPWPDGSHSVSFDLTGIASGAYILAARIPGALVQSR